MVHFLSILFFIGLLAGLLVLLETIVRNNLTAVIAALRGSSPARSTGARGSALDHLGICLRASFAAGSRDGFGDDMAGLLLQLSARRQGPRWSRGRASAAARAAG